MRMKMVVGALAAVGGLCELQARTFEVAAWRGETVTARVPDFAELGEAPNGIGVRRGTLKLVKYAPVAESLQRLEVYDRVSWDSDDDGPRVVEISVPSDAEPGIYTCGMMNIRVIDRVLPPAREWGYFLDLWQHPWTVSRYHGVKPFSPGHYRKMRPVWELLASAGQKTITTTLLPEAWDHQCRDAYGTMIGRVKKDDGSWRFDYSVFDEYVEFCRSCGLGPAICCYTMCPWGYVVRWQNENGKGLSCVAKPGTKEFEEYWGDFLGDFARHLADKGWLKDAYISMDERSIEDVRMIGEFIRRHAPDLRISMAGNRLPSKYGVTIDDFCMILGDGVSGEYVKEAAERRGRGLVTTYYVCCGPAHPNTFMASGPGEAFWLGAFPAMVGLDGFLRWAWNSWPQDPKEDATFGGWRAGDAFLCYPDGEPSWRFLELRNGIVAAEKTAILKRAGLFKEELDKLALRYKVGEAVAGKSDYVGIRNATLALVNAQPKEPRISVFAHYVQQIAKGLRISKAEAASRLYALGIRGFDTAYTDPALPELASTCLKPINLYGA